MRERLKLRRKVLPTAGITPACAGKTSKRYPPSFGFWDHPRMCGKDDIHAEPPVRRLGSPPHVRERHPAIDDLPEALMDHPRMCGKDPLGDSKLSFWQGSPPHVRERQSFAHCLRDAYGITPACAGKTQM